MLKREGSRCQKSFKIGYVINTQPHRIKILVETHSHTRKYLPEHKIELNVDYPFAQSSVLLAILFLTCLCWAILIVILPVILPVQNGLKQSVWTRDYLNIISF